MPKRKNTISIPLLGHPTNKLFMLFLNYSVNVFDVLLTSLQASEPIIHILIRCLHKLVRNVLIHFVNLSVMTGKSADQVQFKSAYNQKPDSELDDLFHVRLPELF